MNRSAAILFLSAAVAASAAASSTPLKVGVLAYRPKAQVMAQWQPVAAYLESALGQPVELTAQDYSELNPEITLADIWHRYAAWISTLAAVLLLLAMAGAGLVRLNRRLHRSLAERMRAETALQASETKYRIVADNTYDWEFWQDPGGRFVYTSPSCWRITGREAKEYLADPSWLRRMVYPDDLERYDQHVSAVLEQRLPSSLEYRIVRPDGTVRWIDHVCQAVFDGTGNFLGRRGSNRDITERKRAQEALLELNQELEQRVKERTAALEAKNLELEQMLRAFVGRELRMLELKERLRRLEAEAGGELKATEPGSET